MAEQKPLNPQQQQQDTAYFGQQPQQQVMTPNAPRKSTGFTNIQSYLQANKPTQLAQGVQSQVQGAAQKAKKEVQEGQQGLQQGMSAAQEAQKAALDKVTGNISGGNLQELEQGFTSLQQANPNVGVADKQNIVAQARRAQAMAQQAGTEGGQQALLKAKYGQQGLTRGGLGLDQALLASSGADLSGARREAAGVQRDVLGLIGEEAQAQNDAQQRLSTARAEALAKISAGQTEAQGLADTVLQSQNAIIDSAKKKLSQGNFADLSNEELEMLQNMGITGNFTTGNVDEAAREMAAQLGQIQEADKLKLLSPEQRARLEVLSRLSGKADISDQVKALGEAGFDMTSLAGDVAGLQSRYGEQLTSAQQASRAAFDALAKAGTDVNKQRQLLKEYSDALNRAKNRDISKQSSLESLTDSGNPLGVMMGTLLGAPVLVADDIATKKEERKRYEQQQKDIKQAQSNYDAAMKQLKALEEAQAAARAANDQAKAISQAMGGEQVNILDWLRSQQKKV